jgi:hypothetical protein
VEWRNARFYNDNSRVTFEVIFSESNGDITFAYANLDASARAQGSQAVVGIENADGTDGFEYSFQQPVLSAGNSVTFHAPGAPPVQTATVSGTVTQPGGGAASGVTVTLTGVGTTTTAADGTYSFTNVPLGSFTISAGSGTACGGQTASAAITVNGNTTANLALANVSLTDSFGYKCTDGAATYIAGTTSTGLSGDDKLQQITLPFAVTLYGTSYTTGWIDTNGVLSFVNPGRATTSFGQHLPNAAAPNAAIYPFWDDLYVDGQASILTGTTGSSPNRKFVVEWRNVGFYPERNTRVNFEIIFTEGSHNFQVVWHQLGSDAMGQGGSAVIGIENSTGTVGFEYQFQQASLLPDHGVTFISPS